MMKSLVKLHLDPAPKGSRGKPVYLRPGYVAAVVPVARGCSIYLADGTTYVVSEAVETVIRRLDGTLTQFRLALPTESSPVEVWISTHLITHCVDANDYVEARVMGGRSFLLDEPFTNIVHATEGKGD